MALRIQHPRYCSAQSHGRHTIRGSVASDQGADALHRVFRPHPQRSHPMNGGVPEPLMVRIAKHSPIPTVQFLATGGFVTRLCRLGKLPGAPSPPESATKVDET